MTVPKTQEMSVADSDPALGICKPKGRNLSSSAVLYQNAALHSHFALALEKREIPWKTCYFFFQEICDFLINKSMEFYCRMVNRCRKGAALQL